MSGGEMCPNPFWVGAIGLLSAAFTAVASGISDVVSILLVFESSFKIASGFMGLSRFLFVNLISYDSWLEVILWTPSSISYWMKLSSVKRWWGTPGARVETGIRSVTDSVVVEISDTIGVIDANETLSDVTGATTVDETLWPGLQPFEERKLEKEKTGKLNPELGLNDVNGANPKPNGFWFDWTEIIFPAGTKNDWDDSPTSADKNNWKTTKK